MKLNLAKLHPQLNAYDVGHGEETQEKDSMEENETNYQGKLRLVRGGELDLKAEMQQQKRKTGGLRRVILCILRRTKKRFECGDSQHSVTTCA